MEEQKEIIKEKINERLLTYKEKKMDKREEIIISALLDSIPSYLSHIIKYSPFYSGK